MKKHILFIINPISGTKQKQSIPDEIAATLDMSRFDYDVELTTHAGHAAEMTREAAAQGVDIVVAVGGDGTVNEVARSLVHTQTALGIIPCGSGNGLARHLQIPQTTHGAIEIINQGVVHCLDYCRINEVPFFCTCGMGFDAFVCQKFTESGKRGLIQYAKNTIGSGINYKPETYVITDDNGTTELEAFLITCANASQYGNNAYIAPTASMKDGLMDVVILKPFPTIEGAQVLLQMFTKTLHNNAHVTMFQSSKIHVTRTAPGPVHCDGEPLMMGRELEVELIRQSFNVVVNPDAHNKKKNLLLEISERFEDLFSLDVLKQRSHGEDEKKETIDSFDASDPFNLQRFSEAQEGNYVRALEEIRHGKKTSHWMWYVFPQMRGLGRSAMSNKYSISGREEAEQYLLHPLLGPRLLEITEELLYLDKQLTAYDIFGHPDDMKLRSCMTLFASISEEGNLFEKILNRYFDGRQCLQTLALLDEKVQ